MSQNNSSPSNITSIFEAIKSSNTESAKNLVEKFIIKI